MSGTTSRRLARRVVIVEPNPTGHRLFYVHLLADAADRSGDAVTLVLGGTPAQEDLRVHLTGLSANVEVLLRPVSSVKEVAAISRSLSASLTVVPDGDGLALELARRGRWSGLGELSLLVMREKAQPSSFALMTAMKSMIRTAAFIRVASMPRVRLRMLKSSSWRGKSRFNVARDPIRLSTSPESVARFRESHRVREDRYWFAVLGAVSARKNLPLILDALRSIDAPVGLLVAGRFGDDVLDEERQRLLQMSREGRAIVIDRLLSDEELDAAVAVADCVVLAHSNEGPSGLLGKAAAIGTRVVASGAQSLRHDLSAHEALGTWVPLEVGELAIAFRQATTQQRPSAVLSADSRSFTTALLR